MPIPKPSRSESRQNFLKRCMGDDTMTSEYTDTDQRLAVCTNEYDSYKEDSIENEEKEEIRKDVFDNPAEANARAKQIGCEGIHSLDEDGNKVFMPCATHEEYTELTGDEVSGYKPKKPKKKDNEEVLDTLAELKDIIEVKSDLEIIKAYDDEEEDKEYGRFEGYGSVFGNKDLGNDVIEKGAFSKSLRKRKAKGVKLLYQHKSDMPIGVFDEIKEDDHGLVVKGRLALKTQAGAEAYELLKMGALDGLSIGFRVNPKEVSYDKRANKRIIKEVDLMEVSLVTFPMNPQATVRSVKGEQYSIREWENGLRDAFSLSRSEAKVAAKAVTKCFDQREVDESAELVDAIKELTLTLKT
jgi:HK97 family phage prohead protease